MHKSKRIEVKKMNITPLLTNTNNFTMYESVSNVSMPSMFFLLNEGVSNLTKPHEKQRSKKIRSHYKFVL